MAAVTICSDFGAPKNFQVSYWYIQLLFSREDFIILSYYHPMTISRIKKVWNWNYRATHGSFLSLLNSATTLKLFTVRVCHWKYSLSTYNGLQTWMDFRFQNGDQDSHLLCGLRWFFRPAWVFLSMCKVTTCVIIISLPPPSTQDCQEDKIIQKKIFSKLWNSFKV